jgi:hypothetical protein
MSTPGVTWRGASGKEYAYWVYPIQSLLDDVPGNFVCARLEDTGEWVPVYVGQTSRLRRCLRSAEERWCVRVGRATHIHVRIDHRDEAIRQAEVDDLVAGLGPFCNERLAREKDARIERADGVGAGSGAGVVDHSAIEPGL